MSGSDLKFFAVILLVAVGAYWLVLRDWKGKSWNLAAMQRDVPSVTFVPPGTPGAITWEEYQEKRWGPVPRR
jgi:hypothetical protein